MPDTNQSRAPQGRPDGRTPPSRAAQPQSGGRREAPRPKKRKRRRRPILLTLFIRIFQLIGTLLLIGIVTGSFMACFAVVYVKTSIMPNTYLRLEDYTMDENSVIMYEDRDSGQLRELQTLVGSENREIITYDQIPENLINAYIAVEDKRFWQHRGVDWVGTGRGLLSMFTGGSIRGGSTITQQTIKNLTKKDDVTVNRKILEIFTALELEKNYRKEDVLTTYFNKIFMGYKCSGVQSAAQFYFGKNVWELSLAECASLAGITNNPSLYSPYGTVDVVRYQCQNPECRLYSLSRDPVCEYCGAENSYDSGREWTNRDFNKARQELILNLMADPEISPNGAYITEAERDAAIAEPLVFLRDIRGGQDEGEEEEAAEAKPANVYSWYTEAVIKEATRLLVENTTMNEETANDMVFSGGLTIVCAYDPEVQAAVDTVFNNRENLDQVSSRTGQRLISAISVVDNSTGLVVAMGSTQEKTSDRVWVTPVQTVRPPGSSIKPLSVYSPAIDMGLITPASVVDDNPFLLNGSVWPLNVSATYKGLTSVLDAVTVSLNTVAVRVLQQITPQASYDFMVNKYGFTSLEAYRVTSTGKVLSDIDISPLSMGGLTDGVSTFEMAAAYATFPRGGTFTKATTVLEIRDSRGDILVDNRPSPEFPIKETTAYYMNSLLTNVVTSGTGGNARISGQTVAGKTGTTNDAFDYWFCGYTHYYTAAVWTGYPYFEEVNRTHFNPSIPMWQKVMAILHEDKENVAFDVPGTLTSYTVCRDCGKRATAACAMDTRGNRSQSFRLFAADAPTEECDCHVEVRVCMDSPILNANGEGTGRYHLAGEFCPEETVRTFTMVNYERELASPSVHPGDQNALLSWYESIPEEQRYCHTHGEGWEPEPPEPPETDEPWPLPSFPSVDPWPSGPVTDPWPDVTSEMPDWLLPPTPSVDPWPTMEPPQPSFDPVFPPGPPDPDPGDYVPAVDEWGNPLVP